MVPFSRPREILTRIRIFYRNAALPLLDTFECDGGAVFISSPEACDSLRAAAGSDFGRIADRVVSVDPEWKKI
jgi:hypothetical protein